jgi:hypothetical protein
MPLVELTEKEHSVIEVIRQFRFLRDYSIIGLTVYSDEPTVIFGDWRAKRKIEIKWANSDYFTLRIEKGRWLFKKQIFIHDLYSYFQAEDLNAKMDSGNYCEIIKKHANFAKENLFTIMTGLEWIKAIEKRNK